MLDHNNRNLKLFYWSLYDFGCSAFSAIVQTFIFAPYFVQHVTSDPVSGGWNWGLINSFSAIVIALLAPILGAIADQGKKRKHWLVFFTLLCILTTAFLWFVKPDSTYVTFALLLSAIAIISSELAFVFYNSMLKSLAPASSVGTWSGVGLGFGYFGGLAALTAALILFVGENALFSTHMSENLLLRATFPMAAFWYLIFSLPLLFFVPEEPVGGKPIRGAIVEGIKEMKRTFTNLSRYRHILKFLIARMFFMDGLLTLFVFGGIWAATVFDIQEKNIMVFGIVLHVFSGLGAFSFSRLDDIFGAKNLILFSLLGLFVPSFILLFVTTKWLFWALACCLGVFVGPVQSASRSLMVRFAPEHLENEMFGLFALSGKLTTFLGPLLVSAVAFFTQNLRASMSVILFFFAIGFILMLLVPSNSNGKPKKPT